MSPPISCGLLPEASNPLERYGWTVLYNMSAPKSGIDIGMPSGICANMAEVSGFFGSVAAEFIAYDRKLKTCEENDNGREAVEANRPRAYQALRDEKCL